MDLKAAKCPGCGAALQNTDERSRMYCTYCGQLVILGNDTADEKQAVENWMGLATAASLANNYSEAYKYYTQVLEHDPSNYEAWLGKAAAAGWTSTLAQFRLSEMVVASNNAVKFAPEPKSATASRAAATIGSVSNTVLIMSMRNSSTYSSVPGVKETHYLLCLTILDGYDAAQELDPTTPQYTKDAIALCNSILQIASIYAFTGMVNTFSSALDVIGDAQEGPRINVQPLTQSYWTSVRVRRDAYIATMLTLDPGFKDSAPSQKKAGCFVATAVLGDANHPTVVTLRQLRDEILANTRTGRKLIEFYYDVGPTLASVLTHNESLRLLSYWFIVMPAGMTAEFIILIRRLARNSTMS